MPAIAIALAERLLSVPIQTLQLFFRNESLFMHDYLSLYGNFFDREFCSEQLSLKLL
jgi:hypothetical protein